MLVSYYSNGGQIMGCPSITIRTFEGEEIEVQPIKAWKVKNKVIGIVRYPNGTKHRTSLPDTYPAPCP